MASLPPDPFELNVRHLRALNAIVTRGSMSAAAEAVSLTQPALTQGLAKLELQVGVTLFERHHGGMTATAAGRRLAERSVAAFDHLARATRGVHRSFARPEWLMTATQLRAFLALADSGGFTPAAERIGLSQPAVHRAIRDLEKILGVALAERRGRGVFLTAAGRRLARGVRLAAGEWATALGDLTRGDEPAGGRIVIGAMPLCRARLLPMALARLWRRAPASSIKVVEGSWRELVEPLRDGVIDLMIGALREAPTAADLVQAPLFEDRLAIVGRAGHPLAGPAEVDPERLAAYPWVVGPQGSPLRQVWETLFSGQPGGRAPVECGSVMTTRGLLGESDFLTLLSPEQVSMEVQTGLLAFVGPPLARFPRRIGLTTRLDWRPSTVQRLFVDLLGEVAAEPTLLDS